MALHHVHTMQQVTLVEAGVPSLRATKNKIEVGVSPEMGWETCVCANVCVCGRDAPKESGRRG